MEESCGMDLSNGYIAIDWGTTNRRVYTLDSYRNCIDQFEDDKGILGVEANGFDVEIANLRNRLGDLPILLAGMIGSDRGWHQAPYVSCPAGLGEIARAILWIEPRRIGIVPGVSQTSPHADVMRGEEVQALGARATGLVAKDAIICHPGTHAKWIVLADGCIDSFATTMTGELFGLLQRHSILAPQLTNDVAPGPAFDTGVAQALAGADVLAKLFSIRARRLVGQASEDGADYVSGLLIGADVRGALARHPSGPVAVLGRPDLCVLYSAALTAAGRQASTIDGTEAFIAGMNAIAEQIA